MIKKNRRPTGLKDEIVIQGTTTGRVSGRAPARANRPKAETARSPKVTPHFKGGHSSSALGITLHQTTATYTADAMREYGTEVVEQRAIPDFRDGLKPVQRMALWSLRKLGMHSTSGFKKSARVVGEIIGKFHPHGDGSAYQAMVGIAGTKYQDKSLGKGWAGRNCAVPLVEGVGNWGDFIDSAAAYRYTECRLSKFSDMYLLDPDYLAVMDYVPNFDDSEKVPVVLPAKVPVVLLNGFSSIAVGVSGSSAPFGLPGVLKLTRKALEGAEVTIRDCVRTLTFDYPYGGVCISEPKDLVPVFKGKGSAAFMPTYELSDDQKTLTFINVCPGLMSSRSIETFLDKLSLVRGVATVDDDTNKRGARYVVTFARTLKGPELEAAIDHCLDISIRSDSYDIGITIRDPLGRASFRRASIPEIFKLWAEWRLDIEVKVIARLILLQEKHKARQELLLLAVDNLETIIKALRVKQATASVTINGEVSEVDASAAYLMKALKISLEDANSILDMKVRQLRAMERTRILAKIKEHLVEIKHLKVYHKAPHTRVIEDLDRMMTVEL